MSTDPIREGYVKVKSKHLGTWNKRWLKLRAANARQPNRLEKYQDESVASNGGERTTYDLTDVRYVDRMKAKDKKHAVCIVLQSYDVVQFALNSDMEANSWLQDAQRLLFGKTDVSSMFEVYLMKAPALNNASGECLLQVTEDSVRLLDIDNPRRVQLELPLATIRRYSTERGMLRLVTGRSSPIGESELMFDTTETDAIYSGIQRATKEMVARTKHKQPSTAAATEGVTNCYETEPSRGANSTGSISKVRTNNSFSSTTSSVRSIDSRRPPEYEDSPPPYTAPDVPKGRSSSSRSTSANKQFGQEYVESVDGEHYLEPASKPRSKSDSTYSSKSSTSSEAGGSSRRTGGSGRNHEQLDEETPIYNADSVSDIYDDDQGPSHHQQLGYGGDRRQTGRGGGKVAGGPSSARGGSSRQAKNAGSSYDLETDYHGVEGQGVYYTSSSPPPPLPEPASVRAARGKPGSSVQYSVPGKTSRQLPQQRSEATESYYDDVVGNREFDQERDRHWSSGNISGSFTDRVQATADVTSPPPRMPTRRGQQSQDYEDKALDNVLAKMVADELHLRTSLKVDRYELE